MSPINHFPDYVVVQVNGPSLEGLAVRLRFGMRKKNSFSYLVFLDPHGKAEVSGEELLRTFDEQRNTFIMDYGDPRIGFTGEIDSKVFSAAELKSAMEAFNMFRGKLSFPDNYEALLTAALQRGQNPDEYQVEVRTTR